MRSFLISLFGIGFLLLLYAAAEAGSFLIRIDYLYYGLSVLTLLLYAKDKRAAIKGKWRVPERVLHTLELLGGWPGAWIGQKWFHHKVSKTSFMWKFYICLLMNLVGLALLSPLAWDAIYY